jgi:hypothetical protein
MGLASLDIRGTMCPIRTGSAVTIGVSARQSLSSRVPVQQRASNKTRHLRQFHATDGHTHPMQSDQTDNDGLPEEWNEDAHAEWCATWAPRCPLGNPQRPATLTGYREREPGRLQLRVVLRARTEGVCDAIVEEDEETIRVRVLLCWEDSSEHFADRDYLDCPVHVYLDRPLTGRAVICVDDEQPLPLYEPQWEIEHNRRVAQENRARGWRNGVFDDALTEGE